MEDFVVDIVLQHGQELFVVAWMDPTDSRVLTTTEPSRTELEIRDRLRELELSPDEIESRIAKARAQRASKSDKADA